MTTIRWTGNAPAVAQVNTITVGGTPAAAQVYTVTINGKSVTYTALNTDTNTTIATALLALLTASTLPEFLEITWANPSAAVVTGTAFTAGVVFTQTSVSSGTGTLVTANTTVSTGPNDLSSLLNYSTGALPINGDILIIENCNTTQSLLYNLSALSGVTLAELHVRASFTGYIGLPKTAATGYAEYRPDYLAIGATLLYLGRGAGSGSGRVKINTGSVQTTIFMDGMGSPSETGLPAFIWKGTHASNALFATKGNMGACIFGGEVATVLTIDVAFQTNRSGDVTFIAQTGLTWTTLNQTGGTCTLFSAGTTQNVSGGICTQKEGAITTLNLRDDRGSQPQYIANGAGTITTVNAAGKVTFDASQSQRAFTITNANCYGPVKWLDPFQRITYTNGILLSQTGLEMDDGPSINRGRNYTISFS